jgi:TetR/AcrR family transcriptional regulator, repressor of fatR-cypB operon
MVIPVSRKRTHDESRQQIIEAALAAFAERGFHGTSIPEIATAAGVGVASIYRRFESKEHLVNAVFRDAKSRLRDALLLGLDLAGKPRVLFLEVWARLVRFARLQPVAFQFLEMQDHVPYLDGESRALEASLLVPIVIAAEAATRKGAPVPPPVLIAMVWGAFVGLSKAARLGYLAVDEATLLRAGEVCYAAIATTHLKGE